MDFNGLLQKVRDGESLTKDDLVSMLGYPSDSPESYRLMPEANHISKHLTQHRAEIHAQLALDSGPCNCDCLFCSFARANYIFTAGVRLSAEQAVAYARQFEDEGGTRSM